MNANIISIIIGLVAPGYNAVQHGNHESSSQGNRFPVEISNKIDCRSNNFVDLVNTSEKTKCKQAKISARGKASEAILNTSENENNINSISPTITLKLEIPTPIIIQNSVPSALTINNISGKNININSNVTSNEDNSSHVGEKDIKSDCLANSSCNKANEKGNNNLFNRILKFIDNNNLKEATGSSNNLPDLNSSKAFDLVSSNLHEYSSKGKRMINEIDEPVPTNTDAEAFDSNGTLIPAQRNTIESSSFAFTKDNPEDKSILEAKDELENDSKGLAETDSKGLAETDSNNLHVPDSSNAKVSDSSNALMSASSNVMPSSSLDIIGNNPEDMTNIGSRKESESSSKELVETNSNILSGSAIKNLVVSDSNDVLIPAPINTVESSTDNKENNLEEIDNFGANDILEGSFKKLEETESIKVPGSTSSNLKVSSSSDALSSASSNEIQSSSLELAENDSEDAKNIESKDESESSTKELVESNSNDQTGSVNNHLSVSDSNTALIPAPIEIVESSFADNTENNLKEIDDFDSEYILEGSSKNLEETESSNVPGPTSSNLKVSDSGDDLSSASSNVIQSSSSDITKIDSEDAKNIESKEELKSSLKTLVESDSNYVAGSAHNNLHVSDQSHALLTAPASELEPYSADFEEGDLRVINIDSKDVLEDIPDTLEETKSNNVPEPASENAEVIDSSEFSVSASINNVTSLSNDVTEKTYEDMNNVDIKHELDSRPKDLTENNSAFAPVPAPAPSKLIVSNPTNSSVPAPVNEIESSTDFTGNELKVGNHDSKEISEINSKNLEEAKSIQVSGSVSSNAKVPTSIDTLIFTSPNDIPSSYKVGENNSEYVNNNASKHELKNISRNLIETNSSFVPSPAPINLQASNLSDSLAPTPINVIHSSTSNTEHDIQVIHDLDAKKSMQGVFKDLEETNTGNVHGPASSNSNDSDSTNYIITESENILPSTTDVTENSSKVFNTVDLNQKLETSSQILLDDSSIIKPKPASENLLVSNSNDASFPLPINAKEPSIINDKVISPLNFNSIEPEIEVENSTHDLENFKTNFFSAPDEEVVSYN